MDAVSLSEIDELETEEETGLEGLEGAEGELWDEEDFAVGGEDAERAELWEEGVDESFGAFGILAFLCMGFEESFSRVEWGRLAILMDSLQLALVEVGEFVGCWR